MYTGIFILFQDSVVRRRVRNADVDSTIINECMEEYVRSVVEKPYFFNFAHFKLQ